MWLRCVVAIFVCSVMFVQVGCTSATFDGAVYPSSDRDQPSDTRDDPSETQPANEESDPTPPPPSAEPSTPPSPDPETPEPDSVDSDGDGLLDDEEGLLGSDPYAVDTDGDGFDDGEEVDGSTDPTDSSDHPYTGGWAMGACRDGVVSSGHSPGQVAADFALTDQHGETVRLHDFCDRAVLLVTSAYWCGPCQGEAPELQAMYDQHEADGFIVITLLGEGDPSAWASAFGLTHPVLADPNYAASQALIGSPQFSMPTLHLLTEGAEVVSTNSWVSESSVQAALP